MMGNYSSYECELVLNKLINNSGSFVSEISNEI